VHFLDTTVDEDDVSIRNMKRKNVVVIPFLIYGHGDK